MTFLSMPDSGRPFGSEPGEAILAAEACGNPQCGRMVLFHPDLVPSILIDPATGRPPDVGEDNQPIPLTDEARARSVARPLCRPCVDAMNRGGHNIRVLPGAYPAE